MDVPSHLSTLLLSQYYNLSAYVSLSPLIPTLWLSQYYNLSAYVCLYLAVVPSPPHSLAVSILYSGHLAASRPFVNTDREKAVWILHVYNNTTPRTSPSPIKRKKQMRRGKKFICRGTFDILTLYLMFLLSAFYKCATVNLIIWCLIYIFFVCSVPYGNI